MMFKPTVLVNNNLSNLILQPSSYNSIIHCDMSNINFICFNYPFLWIFVLKLDGLVSELLYPSCDLFHLSDNKAVFQAET